MTKSPIYTMYFIVFSFLSCMISEARAELDIELSNIYFGSKDTYHPGEEFYIGCRVNVQGDLPDNEAQIDYYLGDYLLASHQITKKHSGEGLILCTIPEDIPLGEYTGTV